MRCFEPSASSATSASDRLGSPTACLQSDRLHQRLDQPEVIERDFYELIFNAQQEALLKIDGALDGAESALNVARRGAGGSELI